MRTSSKPFKPKIEKGVRILSPVSKPFQETYLRARKKENRIYSDAEVFEFPDTFFYNLHRPEWELRKKSINRLLKYLKRRESLAKVIDLGCGNGWASARISRIPNYTVTGIDINMMELEQAARVFANEPHLFFCYGDIFEDILEMESFDYIIINSAIQYFSNLQQLINRCRQYLKPGGEIHILDSPLYSEKDWDQAVERSRMYYDSIGCPEMANLYFHHLKSSLSSFDYQYLYRPKTLRLIGKKDSPFPWVKVIN